MPDDSRGFDRRAVAPAVAWLDATHRGAIRAHLRRLGADERERRFGRVVGHDDIATIVDDFYFGAHWLIGAFSFDQRLIGLAHACAVRQGRDWTVYAAFSVERDHRGRGIGRALLGAIVDRLHRVAASTVVAIDDAFDTCDERRGDRGRPAAYELCAGVRITAERLRCERAYRDTIARVAA